MQTTPNLPEGQALHPLPADEHARSVRTMFDRIATAYDLLNHLLSFGMDYRWRKLSARDFSLDDMEIIVDACGGTGDLSLAIGRILPKSTILCTDFSHEMLKVTKHKFHNTSILTSAGDALHLPVRDISVDGITCAFGIRNVTDLDACLKEFNRILRPRGRLLILDFMAGQKGVFHWLFRCYFRFLVPMIGRIISRDRKAYTYLPSSVERFVTADEMAERIKNSGFAVLKIRSFSFGAATEFIAEKRTGG